MNINDNDDQTVWCAIARCADFLPNSYSDDFSDDDYDSSLAETCYPNGLKSDCGGQGSVSLVNATEKKDSFINPCRNMQQFICSF
jgi:hypothetical protein